VDNEFAVPRRAESGLLKSGAGPDGEKADDPPRPNAVELRSKPLARQDPPASYREDLLDDESEAPLVADEESPSRSRGPDDPQRLDLAPGFRGDENVHAPDYTIPGAGGISRSAETPLFSAWDQRPGLPPINRADLA